MTMLGLYIRFLLLIAEFCLGSEVGQSRSVRQCSTNADCNLSSVCLQNICSDPCSGSSLCGANALCHVVNQRPLCECAPGFTGVDGDCQPESPTAYGRECLTNAQCDSTSTCLQGECANPCMGSKCGPNTLCAVVEHMPVCECAPGFSNDGTGCLQKIGSRKQIMESSIGVGIIKHKLFWIGNEKLNFTDAITSCYSKGMILASINNIHEQYKLETTINKYGISQADRVWTSGYCFGKTLFWITSGRAVSFPYWKEDPNPNSLNPKHPDCALMEASGSNCVVTSVNNRWQLSACGEGNFYACEYFNKSLK